MASAKSRSVLRLGILTLRLMLLQLKGLDRPSLVGTLIKMRTSTGYLTGRTPGLPQLCSTCAYSRPSDCLFTVSLSVAGAETTSGVLVWWMLAMVTNPGVQKCAQAELDAVVGRTRTPTFADFQHLPYIRATVKEALRWRHVLPIGIPHLSTEDDWYDGMFIPKGTIVMANVWDLNRDPELYGADAANFNPARFLDAGGSVGACPPETKATSLMGLGGVSVWASTLRTILSSSISPDALGV